MNILDNQLYFFSVGDKVLHNLSEDEEMVGTITDSLPNNRFTVEFWIPGRRKKGYMVEMEFDGKELTPCYIDIKKTKRASR